MLIGIFSGLSAAAAIFLCAATNSFEGLGWLFLLPVAFFVCFALLAALWFLLMVIMAKRVNMEQEQENDDPFYRTVIYLTIEALVPILQIHIHTQGLEQIPKNGRFLLVCNHLHDTDPVVLLWAMKRSGLAFISKREVNEMFIVGPFLHKILGQPINRENDREALKTILNCIRVIKEDKASIAVFPEGYVSKEHKLHPFRSGVFKIAQKAQVPVVVCTVRNTHQIYKNMPKLKPTHVDLHVVGVISAQELKDTTAVDVGHRAYDMMAQDLGPDLVLPLSEDTQNT